MPRVIRYIFSDLLRTRFTILYTVFLLVSTMAMFQLDTDPGKVIMSLMSIVLMVVPLISIIFTTIHYYNSHEFVELMLAQPVNRKVIFLSEYLAVACSLSLSLLIGIGVPMILYRFDVTSITLLFTGVSLTLVFVSLAFLASVLTRDKAKAIGVALLFWFYFTLIYDGILLYLQRLSIGKGDVRVDCVESGGSCARDYVTQAGYLSAHGVYWCVLQRLLWELSRNPFVSISARSLDNHSGFCCSENLYSKGLINVFDFMTALIIQTHNR
jgi:hypothetical protein